jgi:hypothetical protein
MQEDVARLKPSNCGKYISAVFLLLDSNFFHTIFSQVKLAVARFKHSTL